MILSILPRTETLSYPPAKQKPSSTKPKRLVKAGAKMPCQVGPVIDLWMNGHGVRPVR